MRPSGEDEVDEEYRLFVIRYMQFRNIWTLYWDYVSGRYLPSSPGYESGISDWRSPAEFRITLMFILYSFFYSLVDEDSRAVNAFRIWRRKFPKEEAAIAAVEFRVSPIRSDLKTFRHRIGFHGSRALSHQNPALDLFGNHSGTKMINIMKQFKALAACLLALETSAFKNDLDEMKEARIQINEITGRCCSDSSADFESNDLPPIGI
jgi:hypothetical protein